MPKFKNENPQPWLDPPPENADLPGNDDETLVIPSETILRGRREVWIEHGDTMYRLRRTSSGKLYLSK